MKEYRDFSKQAGLNNCHMQLQLRRFHTFIKAVNTLFFNATGGRFRGFVGTGDATVVFKLDTCVNLDYICIKGYYQTIGIFYYWKGW